MPVILQAAMVDMHRESEKTRDKTQECIQNNLGIHPFLHATETLFQVCVWGGCCYSEFFSPGFAPNEEFDSISPLPPSACRLLGKAKAVCSAAKKPAGCAEAIYSSSTLEMCTHRHTYRCRCWIWHGGKRTARKGYTSHHLSLLAFFRNFPSRVSDFPAILFPIATSSNPIPAGTGTGPTPSAQMRSPREDALEPILTQSLD